MTLWIVLRIIAVSLCFLVAAVIIHEAGHVSMLSRLTGRRVRVRLDGWSFKVGRAADYVGLSVGERRDVYAAGVLAGLLVLIPLGHFIPDSTAAAWSVVLYGVGCKTDLKNMELM